MENKCTERRLRRKHCEWENATIFRAAQNMTPERAGENAHAFEDLAELIRTSGGNVENETDAHRMIARAEITLQILMEQLDCEDAVDRMRVFELAQMDKEMGGCDDEQKY